VWTSTSQANSLSFRPCSVKRAKYHFVLIKLITKAGGGYLHIQAFATQKRSQFSASPCIIRILWAVRFLQNSNGLLFIRQVLEQSGTHSDSTQHIYRL
jgi:hypothetical protein